ncbi:hypothetical protein HY468_04305 [Candidatus Roizmanbacteria bacterium]|nr:hypothetical protein [Candidatus Roizmanbacteria bacterium]
MKKTLIIISLIFVLVLCAVTSIAVAQEEVSPTPTGTEDISPEEENSLKQKILDLKERLATRVAQLQEQNRRAFYGVVKSKDDDSLTITYKDKTMPVVLTESVTIQSKDMKGKQKDVKKDTITVGQSIFAFGTLDLDQKTLLATKILLQEQPTISAGLVTDVDTKEGSFTVEGKDGTTILDYEINTHCVRYEKDLDEDKQLTTCGLSKIEKGDRVYLRIQPDATELSRGVALRILVIPASAEADVTPTKPVE